MCFGACICACVFVWTAFDIAIFFIISEPIYFHSYYFLKKTTTILIFVIIFHLSRYLKEPKKKKSKQKIRAFLFGFMNGSFVLFGFFFYFFGLTIILSGFLIKKKWKVFCLSSAFLRDAAFHFKGRKSFQLHFSVLEGSRVWNVL